MNNPLEQLKEIELKANFTPRERKYFYKLRDELEAIVGGVSIEKLKKPGDVVQARRIRAKLEEILKFVQDRRLEVEPPREKFMAWVKESHLERQFSDQWIEDNFEFSEDKIYCRGDLRLFSVPITYLPDNLHIGGELVLSRCERLSQLPNNLRVDGDLEIKYCTTLSSLPNDLSAGKSVDLTGSSALTKLPDNWQVNGSLSLMACSALVHLPENLSVKGYLTLSSCTALDRVPPNLQVDGNVEAYGCEFHITYTLRDLRASGRITGKVNGS